MILKVNSNSPDKTFEIGEKIGQLLRGNEVILLCGDLGAGKTLFTKGIASSLGINPDNVVSPTFVIMNKFEGDLHSLSHFDLYRLGENIDNNVPEIDEYIDENIIVVEWAQYLSPSYFRLKNSIDIKFRVRDNYIRIIKIKTSLDYITFDSF